jgi:hypothetical protein
MSCQAGLKVDSTAAATDRVEAASRIVGASVVNTLVKVAGTSKATFIIATEEGTSITKARTIKLGVRVVVSRQVIAEEIKTIGPQATVELVAEVALELRLDSLSCSSTLCQSFCNYFDLILV